jgi:hypothetical protein
MARRRCILLFFSWQSAQGCLFMLTRSLRRMDFHRIGNVGPFFLDRLPILSSRPRSVCCSASRNRWAICASMIPSFGQSEAGLERKQRSCQYDLCQTLPEQRRTEIIHRIQRAAARPGFFQCRDCGASRSGASINDANQAGQPTVKTLPRERSRVRFASDAPIRPGDSRFKAFLVDCTARIVSSAKGGPLA